MYDIFYVSLIEKKINRFWEEFKIKYPSAKYASSFQDAQKKCLTKFFWIVWDDLLIKEDFKFDYKPDAWSNEYVHVFKNRDSFDGICLVPKHVTISKKEIDHRFFVNKKEIDIVASYPKPYDVFEIETYDDYLEALEKSTTEMFWGKLRSMTIKDKSVFDLYFAYDNTYDRMQNHTFLHDINGETKYDGLHLFSKYTPVSKKEIDYKFIVNRKEWNVVASIAKPYDVFEIDTYDEYLSAFETSTTEMFWMSSRNITATIPDIYFLHNNSYDRKQNHAFIHQVGDEQLYNGLFLCSKHKPLTQREVEYRHLVNRKEWNVVASIAKPYDVFEIDTYDEYLSAFETSTTEMFWMSSRNITATIPDIYFLHNNSYDRKQNHAFIHQVGDEQLYNGLFLCSKHKPLTQREVEYRHLVDKKEWDIIGSTPKPYDIVFISYQEPNADTNYNRLLKKYPLAKRIHGVRGIHQAHIAAAKICETEMFWVVDGDAEIIHEFNFDYCVSMWDRETVHVWRSQNPVNNLVYGYGGVKLLPRQLTIDMDTSKPDMTTSISSKFKAVHEISNITAFNTDPFNTWKSAFRECAKLSSRIIDRQNNSETQQRLDVWCSVGTDKPYGKYAILGAIAGEKFGSQHRNNVEELQKINNFDWLKEQFDATN